MVKEFAKKKNMQIMKTEFIGKNSMTQHTVLSKYQDLH